MNKGDSDEDEETKVTQSVEYHGYIPILCFPQENQYRRSAAPLGSRRRQISVSGKSPPTVSKVFL